ncbi:uncharacterized protein BX663DRAFT_512374 [Cokeromyces recurvatus]|uniref:uncharacterized protein n=1 Tax=Cokeromyces recurvatus TaxID=90255 RepID=UPI00221F0F2F|nr:uncharacterized protein BX663DRAFT_512374 [Cokeromyces recurvatus]KAI7901774.1 hypothetical protein BX663DRAFT_512374 [Cokeromyces recurvatus]
MTEAEKFQKHIYKNKNNNTKDAPKNVEETAKKPVSIIEQLNEKKRKNEESVEEKKKEESNNKKSKKDEESKNKKSKKNLASWSSTELDVDESKNLKNALREVLKEGKSLSLKDVRKKTIQLIEKHPKYKKSDLKKSFEKTFTLTLKDSVIIFE